jgi:hypothetical protein
VWRRGIRVSKFSVFTIRKPVTFAVEPRCNQSRCRFFRQIAQPDVPSVSADTMSPSKYWSARKRTITAVWSEGK